MKKWLFFGKSTLTEWNTAGDILLSVVQKVGYDHATHDQKKAVEAFVLGEDVFLQTKSDYPSRGPGSS